MSRSDVLILVWVLAFGVMAGMTLVAVWPAP